jgi:predicted membrane protein
MITIQVMFILHGFYKFKHDPRYKIHKKTSALQLMLLKSVSIQYLLVILFLGIPFFTVMYLVIIGVTITNPNKLAVIMICISKSIGLFL